ncbi:MAG: hypothetical protein HQK79_08675 [Desulfobacterales bacterium]|nr:hypothetical protein [Desulfobacterales bacterium]
MKIKFIITYFIFVIALNAYADNQPEQAKGPVAVFPEKNFTFQGIPEGVEVVHDFVIQNKGTDVLNIEKVKTG